MNAATTKLETLNRKIEISLAAKMAAITLTDTPSDPGYWRETAVSTEPRPALPPRNKHSRGITERHFWGH